MTKEELRNRAEEMLNNISTKEQYMEFLDCISIIHRYNINAIAMILLQRKHPVWLMTKTQWEKAGYVIMDEAQGVMVATTEDREDIAARFENEIWMLYDLEDVEMTKEAKEPIRTNRKALCVQAARDFRTSIGGAFRKVFNAEEGESVDDAIMRKCDEYLALSSAGKQSVCYIVRKWYGVNIPEYDFEDFDGNEIPAIRETAHEIIRETDKAFRDAKTRAKSERLEKAKAMEQEAVELRKKANELEAQAKKIRNGGPLES